MTGSVAAPGGILRSEATEPEPPEGPPQEPADEEGTWTASRALRKFSQLTFAYGVSAALASVSALAMSLPGVDRQWQMVVGLLLFVVSGVISSYVLVDLLEFVWDGFAGRFLDLRGPWARLWGATLSLLLVGLVALVGGLVLSVLAFGDLADFGLLVPAAIALLVACGLAILTALVLPSVVLGPSRGRGVALLAAALGTVAIVAEGIVSLSAPTGTNPFLGWMEGTFPLLNWNAGFGALIAVSGLLTWRSYRLFLPRMQRVSAAA